ncbi:MAG: DUF2179 domain-containing protein [Anaerolineales bacterium]|nr:DUF2179 domain-containing protein [Anaerolineales bacterium]
MEWLDLLPHSLAIFGLRMLDITLYTLRMVMVVRGRRNASWGIAFLQSLSYLNTIRIIFVDADNPLYILSYAAGFATGLVVGMLLEKHFSPGVAHLRIISSECGPELVERLRRAGYGVTEVPAEGRDGCVSLLNCFVHRHDADGLVRLAASIDPQAFITSEDTRLVWRGYWHRSAGMRPFFSRH